MPSILKVLYKCLIVQFYSQNAAFFGLLFLVFFGFIKSSEHIAIGSFLVANPSTLSFLYLLWIAYGIKVILFVNPAINKKENHFLDVFTLLPLKSKINATFAISSGLLLPIFGYALFLVGIAYAQGFYWTIASVLPAMVVLVSVLSLVLLKNLNSLPIEKEFIQLRFLNKIAKPSWLFFIEYLLRKDIILLLLSKVYSCLVIIGASALYSTDQFDLRVITTGVLLSFVGNTAILHKYVWFVYQKMKFSHNLPQSYYKVLVDQFLTFLIMLIPEIVVILRYYPIEPRLLDITGILIYGLSINLLIYSLLLLKQLELSDFIIKVFWLIVLSTFLILFSIHPLILAFMYILIALTIIYLWRFKFEYIEKAN